MKRKFLAALLALVMVFSMIPVSASADGTIYEGNDTFYYHITDSSLANMVAEKGPADSSSDVSQVTITFNHDYSAGGQNTFVFRYGYTIALSNVSDYVQPDDIAYLTISFVDGTSVKISQSELNWTWVETLPRRYDLRLATDDNTCTVTFYYQPGDTVDNSSWREYKQVSVQTGTSLDGSMPALPDEGTAHWVAWETGDNDGTGAEFTADTVVNSDLSVYARKVTDGSGSEYNVMNQDNSLLEAVLKLYVDENPDSGVTTDNVQISGISVNGSKASTNPYYDPVIGSQGPTDNGWRDSNSYFYIYNLDAGAGLIDRNTNTRVPPDDLRSITVYATVDGDNETYTIFRSDLDVRVEDNATIKIYIRDTSEEEEVTPPAAPDKETVINLAGDDAVAVECNTNEEHDQVKYNLNEDSITVGNVVSDGEGGYTCTVTVEPGSYVTAYNDTYSGSDHSLNPTEQNGEILLVFNGDEWTIAGVAPYVPFTVACETEPEEETPPAPDPTEFDISVTVACTNNPSDHAVKYYDNLLKNSYTLGTVTQKGTTYEYTITVQSEKYVEEYSTDYGPHELYANSEPAITVKFIYSDEKWEIPADSKLPVFYVTCAEGGEEQPTPPSITPEEVIALMGDNAIEVACKTEGSEHNPSSYRLILGSFTVGTVTEGEDGTYSCEITIDEAGILQYVAKYSQTVDYEHTTGIYRGPITFTITYDGIKWLQPELPAATITVVCEADQEDELDEDDLNEILGGAITVQCVSEEDHGYKTLTLYELLENASLGDASLENIYSFIKNADGTYTVTLDGEKFASAYGTYVSDKIGKGENIPHQLVNEENADFEIRLTYDGIKWTFDPDPIVIEVTCEDDSGDEPTPTPTPNPGPDPDPDPDPDPIPTPTPGPGGGDKPPYIPPVDPDDSGVSDLLNTDDHIQYLFGYPEGTFGPENNMTRAEVAQMFYNLLLDQDVTITKTFDDVPANAWYAKAVNTLASLGVVSGVGNGDFEPERSITRAEFTSIAMKFAEGKTGGTNIFSDVKSTDWFYRAVVNSTQYGWIHGYGDGTFRPNNPITRVEVTAIVNNMLGREADVDFVTEHYDELNHFSDLAVSHWGYYHIVEATNDHDYTKPSSGENWTELN